METRRHFVTMVVITLIVLLMQAFTYTELGRSLPLAEFAFDKVQHTGGGLASGILGALIVGRLWSPSRTAIVLGACMLAFVVGFGWEIAEHTWPELNGGPHAYTSTDTILDLVCDTLGGVLAGLYCARKIPT